MFPGLRQRFDTALDLIVEFSTLGEYGLAAPVAGDRASAPVDPSIESAGPRMGGAGGDAARAAGQQAAKGAAVTARGAAVGAPLRGTAATPAARRLAGATARPHVSSAEPRPRPRPVVRAQRMRAGAPAVPEQLCLAV
ncbi:MAG: hypothetical protein JW895_18250 [Thermoleophilaceae bacterium]|nr:hypothetical protein [Thermoleophilaceae bacterium]